MSQMRSSGATRRWLWGGLGLVGIVAIALGVVLGRGAPPAAPAPTGSGPRLVFDQTEVDFGKVPFNKSVEHNFVFRNAGTAPLTILERPEVETVEGC